MADSINDLDRFMAAIRRRESGSFEGNYTALGPYTGPRYGRARGAYQIMETIWPGWAASCGIPGADWRSQEAQDHVARCKMTQYFNRYGRWDLVSIAWFAGPGRADRAMREGSQSVDGITEPILGTSVGEYWKSVAGFFEEAPEQYQGRGRFAPSVAEREMATREVRPFAGLDELFGLPPSQTGELETDDPESQLRSIFEAMSDTVAGGRRQRLDDLVPPEISLEPRQLDEPVEEELEDPLSAAQIAGRGGRGPV